jgi:hypothetical protein
VEHGQYQGDGRLQPGLIQKDLVVAAANVVAAIANSGMGALFGSGTDKDVGDQKTSVRPEFFKEQDKVKELTLAYIKEANKLQKVAGTGDIKAIKRRLRELPGANSRTRNGSASYLSDRFFFVLPIG